MKASDDDISRVRGVCISEDVKLRLKVYDPASERIVAELHALRKVAEAAREAVTCPDGSLRQGEALDDLSDALEEAGYDA